MTTFLLQIQEATEMLKNPYSWMERIKSFIMDFGPKVIGAVLIYIIGMWLIKRVVIILKRIFSARKFDESLKSFLISFVKVTLVVLLFLTIASTVGVQITSFAAILAGLSIGVGAALNGSLGNMAGGVMILIFKPFKVGDIITAQGQTGKVTEIGIVNTILQTAENKTIILPNGALSTGVITNFNEYGNLKVVIELAINGDENIDKARAIAIAVMQKFPGVLQDPAPSVVVSKIEGGAIYLSFAPYTTQGEYWTVYSGVLEAIKKAFDEKGVQFPISSMTVTTKNV